ncbi:hypothetical protein [Pleomorphomonas sp. NRK KF1]|uniref:hypothetical protein n=1 Tax=Pleomorphomonas sp. NRK KF1 TaxID=2943000 RepID=UPI0020434D08|nr:hypothetical protein [Pleomorphomonas sp. NRK KF1]MCM5555741.1 hypothetical protein [Pleomorphomonas sp. NRK KF1]
MRLWKEVALVGLFLLAAPQQSFADWPGLLEAPPGFNNLPFSLPAGDAHWCYNLRRELKPVLKEEASFLFEGQKRYLAELLASGSAKIFRLPHSDVAVVARRGCGEVCKVDIVIRSTYNFEIYHNVTVGNRASVEVNTSNDDWKSRFGFVAAIHDLRRNGKKSAFVYQMSRSASRTKAKDSVEYGFEPEKYDDCQTK